ncbi:MAG TPA: N-acetylmuramoyl-L-alanine amidase, partial [Nocardioides sp.]|nr:N-acetylmuramoyl-L-alanine amidase [Nocardioides sp.]
SAVLHTTEFAALGVTWSAGRGAVRVRTRAVDGTWSPWRTLKPLHDRPNHGTEGGRTPVHGTDLAWVGPSDAVQVELEGTQVAPRLTLIDPGHAPTDVPLAEGESGASSREAARNRHPKYLPVIPPLHTRREWRPNPALMNPPIRAISAVRQVHVHHSDNGNHYKRAEVPRMIRSIFRYHTVTLGWADIAYNFLVDRYGRIWVGRRGSMKMARGAHTLGFNQSSVGIAALGNFQEVVPNSDMIHAIARVAAWKLSLFDRDPLGKIWVISEGSDKFRPGQRVHLPVIDGHRNTNDTDCPGVHLYRHLPMIRHLTLHRMSRFDPHERARLVARVG